MPNITSLKPADHDYLLPLSTIFKVPELIYYLGKIPESRQPTVAIVGSRKPTAYGREMGYKLAYQLAERGATIISGLALGIDGLAHQAALDAGGNTIAVLGSGLNHITPTTNYALGQNILNSGGAIISEYEPQKSALPHQFLERNRIISGLADAVVVIEAAARSGSLSTAAHALNQGREVLAVPGNATSVMSQGCNNLIRQGAGLVTCLDDILTAMNLDQPDKQLALPLTNDPNEMAILKLIKNGETDGDKILQQIKIPAGDFNLSLTMLEIKGLIKGLGNNKWGLK